MKERDIDSIVEILKTVSEDTIIRVYPCVRGGEVHGISISVDKTIEKHYRLYNNYDSSMYKITNIIMQYLPDNVLEFRPLNFWMDSEECWERYKNNRKNYIKEKDMPNDENPVDRRELIDELIRQELNVKSY